MVPEALEKKVAEECKESSQASDDDVKLLLDHELPTARNGKCLLACAQEKFGIVCLIFLHLITIKHLFIELIYADS